jgi:hypothetical protein
MLRNIISKTFIIIANLLFGMNLRYFNGSFICETKVLRDLDLKSKGLTIYAEAKIRLIKSGYSYTEVPFEHIGRKYGSSKAVNIKSLFETLDIIRILVADIYFH